MRLSLAKKRYLRRLAGYATNPARQRLRTRLGREQEYAIAGHPVVLPPEHNLPFYQRRDPTYDTYATAVLTTLAPEGRRTLVVDLGANVGDTAVTALMASDGIDVVSVEGSSYFAGYCRRNVQAFGSRARVVEQFVGPIGPGSAAFSSTGTTGGFQSGSAGDVSTKVEQWVTPRDLLADAARYDRVIFKSDIDGYDIHLLVQHWTDIDPAADVLWFEFDPAGTLGDHTDIDTLAALVGGSGRGIAVYDNLGRQMLAVGPGPEVERALAALARWLVTIRQGHMSVPYLDVWAMPGEDVQRVRALG